MIKITKQQNTALQSFLNTQVGLRNQLGAISKMHGKWEGNWKPLNDLPFEDFAELLVMGQYKVKRTIEEILNDFISDSKKDEWDSGEQCLIDLKRELKLEGLI
ncbi:hypothetical protein Riggi_61 [Bacillus phage Riggi]|uniref:Uncharacterized protein n=1 Tax=Bacillus phage Riggi TaxID=2884426 RepID=U5Q044_9CAUD|nr:hypothetical protein Riggi_61 [Bacillus phage Riggi]AGY48223.1 hypothetical protein Riggi_61 [Bacillus phage Riggi]